MRLTEWLTSQHISVKPYHSLANVRFFGFGEDGYYIHMRNDVSHYDNDLERLLQLMQTELTANPDYVLQLDYGARDGIRPVAALPKRRSLELAVWVLPRNGPFPVPQLATLEETLERVRTEVTLFNLTGHWGAVDKENL